MIDKPVK